MFKILTLKLLLLTLFFKGQVKKDSILKTHEIETVVITDKDYKKFEISYDLKQNTNTRYMTIPHDEMGLKFINSFQKNGVINDVILYLHKTDNDRAMTNLEINFYQIDSLTGKPKNKINNEQILYTPKNRSRGKIKINVLDHKIIFPKNGILVAIKWLPTPDNDKKVGPSIRLTSHSEPLTYTRFMNGKWSKKGNIFSKNDKYANIMMGIDVYFKKKRNE